MKKENDSNNSLDMPKLTDFSKKYDSEKKKYVFDIYKSTQKTISPLKPKSPQKPKSPVNKQKTFPRKNIVNPK